MKSVIWQQLIQAVARDATWNIGVPCADQVGIFVSQSFEPSINLATSTALADDPFDFLVAGLADMHAQAIIGEDL